MVGNLTLLTDFYELTMMQGYFKNKKDPVVVFDMFYRQNPSDNGFAIAAGLEQVIDVIKNLNFNYEDVEYLRSLGMFDEDFLDYLSGFHFTGDIYAVPEGTVVFPMEPLVKVVAPIMQAQLVETVILNVICAKKFGVPVLGTHAHSWIMSFPDEYTAFKEYATLYPGNAILLVDTYDTLRSGVPNAIRVFTEMKEAGVKFGKYGIRLDSGDLAYISKKARKMLDEAGFSDASIVASSDLDENLISSLKLQKASIDSWGVGTKLITSADCPAFGGVYKLAAMQKDDGTFEPKIKLSENTWKITNPGDKTIFRIYDLEGKIKGDLIAFSDEKISEDEEYMMFDPIETWKKTRLMPGEFKVRELLKPVFIKGQCVYTSPSVMEIRAYCEKELNTLWDETRRLVNPHEVHVDLTQRLWDAKKKLLDDYNNALQTNKHATELK